MSSQPPKQAPTVEEQALDLSQKRAIRTACSLRILHMSHSKLVGSGQRFGRFRMTNIRDGARLISMRILMRIL